MPRTVQVEAGFRGGIGVLELEGISVFERRICARARGYIIVLKLGSQEGGGCVFELGAQEGSRGSRKGELEDYCARR